MKPKELEVFTQGESVQRNWDKINKGRIVFKELSEMK